MNRNTESRFATVPSINIRRSKLPLSENVKTSWNVGELIPIGMPLEILPGDTLKIKTSKVIRMPALITPIMDSLVLDTYFFFVPNRLVHSHWKNIMGENDQSAWLPAVTYSVPQVTAPSSTGWTAGTLADYYGIPTGVDGISVNAYPFRGYALIVNEFFRSQVTQDPANVPVDDTTVTGSNGTNYITDLCKGGAPFIANKFFDLFTGCTIAPQKGPDVYLNPLSTEDWPVYATSDFHDYDDLPKRTGTGGGYGTYAYPMAWFKNGNSSSGTQKDLTAQVLGASYFSGYSSATPSETIPLQSADLVSPANLWAINPKVMITINEMRMAFQIQKLFERDTYGTRYREILRSHFSVTSPDARMQVPEYLGGNRIPLRISQVLQQSETSTTPQGTPTGVSLTIDVHHDINKSFSEHGFVHCLCVVRYRHSYGQGLHPIWTRKDRLDYYWPELANIGNQPVYNREIYCQGSSVIDPVTGEIVDDQVFGYNEAYASYRYVPDIITGEMRSNYATSLDVWHLGDDYSQLPSLSSSWLQEDKSNVDRILTVQSSVTNQLFGDFQLSGSWIRPMPFYSVPGLIDHH